ncbi:hypothetical protein MAIT1_03056 [Magnetofaba australis IT-1]|uniref:DUF3108 domain-containing protein n=2 Tax=Magnetofaba TaxID=1472292 RepID=A0A1Y2K5G9_9PROT|nr:hypothetical protein MAIT1_03056 [Magnetofaba australis IT-1]
MLTYNIHWVGVPAGRALMRFYTPAQDVFRIEVEIESTGAAGFFYPLLDRIAITGARDGQKLQTLHYEKLQVKEKGRFTEQVFDRDKGVVIRALNHGKPEVLKQVGPEVNEPITALYVARAREAFSAGEEIEIPVVNGQQNYVGRMVVHPREELETPLGRFAVIPVSVHLKKSELFKQERAIQVWFTDDERRLPVRVETDVRIGFMAADLIAFDDGRGHKRDSR